MKRITSFILAFAILMGFATSNASTNEEKVYNSREQFAIALGIIDKETYDADKLISRAEFAEFISKILIWEEVDNRLEKWEENVLGEDEKNIVDDNQSSGRFEDVDSSIPQYKAIETVYRYGYMKGITPTHFAPNYDMTGGAAKKVFVSMLGYSMMAEAAGGYPEGYSSISEQIGLMDGLSFANDDFVTYGDCVAMLSNALDIEIYELKYSGSNNISYESNNKTFQNTILGLGDVRGTLEDNGITTLYGTSKVGVKKVVIGGVEMKIGKCDNVRDYIGRELKAYYRTNEYDENTLVYFELIDDKTITFNATDFIKYKAGKIEFYNEKGQAVVKSLPTISKIIYNNVAIDDWSDDIFDFTYGDITLISGQSGSQYDTAVIRDMMVGKVRRVDQSGKTLYIDTLYKEMSSLSVLDLSKETEDYLSIKNADGENIAFEEIATDDIIEVLKSTDGKIIEIKAYKNKLEGVKITGYSVNGDEEIIVIDDKEFTIRDLKKLKETIIIKQNSIYNVYADFSGNVIWYDEGGIIDADKMGILLRAFSDSDSEKEYIKIYSEDGTMKIYPMAERIKFNNESKKSKATIETIGESLEKLILFRVNDLGEVVSVTTPLAYGEKDTGSRGWYAIVPEVKLNKTTESDADWDKYVSENNMRYQSNGARFNLLLCYDKANTLVFSIPNDRTQIGNEKAYTVGRPSFREANYLINAYSKDPNAIAPDAILYSATAGGQAVNEQDVILVTDINTTVNADGELMTKIKGYNMKRGSSVASSVEMDVADGVVFLKGGDSTEILNPDAADYDIKTQGPAVIDDLEEGDIIRYATNSLGQISSIKLAYDYDTGNAFSAGSDGGAMGFQGATYVGYALNVKNNFIRLSTVKPELVTDSSSVVAQNLSTQPVFIVKKQGRGLSITSGTPNDIASYEDTGKLEKYDRVVVTSYWAFTIGTVIYK